jgi:hypothetical protein
VRCGAHLKSKGAQSQTSTPLFPSQGVPARGRVASLKAKNALRHPCGAGPQHSKTRCGGRNCIGAAALRSLVPGGRAPSPQPLSPHSADRPRSSAKGRGLPFRGRHGPKAIRGQGGSELFDPVCCPTRPHRVSPPHSADVLLGCRECTIIPIIACSHTVRPAWSRVCPPPLQAS